MSIYTCPLIDFSDKGPLISVDICNPALITLPSYNLVALLDTGSSVACLVKNDTVQKMQLKVVKISELSGVGSANVTTSWGQMILPWKIIYSGPILGIDKCQYDCIIGRPIMNMWSSFVIDLAGKQIAINYP